jgi:hypothetical protein
MLLRSIEQPNYHSLRLVIEEGRTAGGVESLNIGGTVLPGVTRIAVTNESRRFELIWDTYVAYSIRCQCRDKTPAVLPVLPTATWAGTRYVLYTRF